MVSLVNCIGYAKMFRIQKSSVEVKKLKYINYLENVC